MKGEKKGTSLVRGGVFENWVLGDTVGHMEVYDNGILGSEEDRGKLMKMGVLGGGVAGERVPDNNTW